MAYNACEGYYVYGKNVDIGGRSKPSWRMRMAKRLVRMLEWLHFRREGALFADDLFPDGLSRQSFTGPPGAQLTEEQRREAADRIRRNKYRIG